MPRRRRPRRLRAAPRSSATGTRSSPTGRRPATGRCASGSPRATASTCRASSSRTARCRASSSSRSGSRAGKRVLVERPTYDRPLKILRELGADVGRPRLRRARASIRTRSRRRSRDGAKPAFLYLIPTFQNPSGRTLSEERRRRIVELAARARPARASRTTRTGSCATRATRCRRCSSSPDGERRLQLLVLEDDRARPPRRLVRLPRSRSRARSRRRRPRRTSRPCCSARRPCTSSSAAASSSRTSSGSSACCARGATRCSPRSTASCPTCATTRPEGGYFLWLELDGVDAAELLPRAEAAGVTFVKGTDFGGEPDTLRLAFSFVSPDEIAEGVSRLASRPLAPVRARVRQRCSCESEHAEHDPGGEREQDHPDQRDRASSAKTKLTFDVRVFRTTKSSR